MCQGQQNRPAPFNVIAVASDNSACLSWSWEKPGQPQESTVPIVSYSVRVQPIFRRRLSDSSSVNATIKRRLFPSISAAEPSAVIDGLRNGYNYRFFVTAINAYGVRSKESEPVDISPIYGAPACDAS